MATWSEQQKQAGPAETERRRNLIDWQQLASPLLWGDGELKVTAGSERELGMLTKASGREAAETLGVILADHWPLILELARHRCASLEGLAYDSQSLTKDAGELTRDVFEELADALFYAVLARANMIGGTHEN